MTSDRFLAEVLAATLNTEGTRIKRFASSPRGSKYEVMRSYSPDDRKRKKRERQARKANR